MSWQLFFLLTIFKSIFCDKLYLSVEENQKPSSSIGSLIKLIQNQTKSIETPKFKSFQLQSGKANSFGNKNLINVDPKNGDIWIQTPIDREEICQTIEKCKKGAFLDYLIYADETIFELQIEIIDINDNFPTFYPDEKTLKIIESTALSTEYPLPVAKDSDSEKYGIKKYELKPISSSSYENYFVLVTNPNNNNPYLRVIKELDRENMKSYEFHLYASDGDGNQGKCKIIVEITDINDNTPQWIGLPYRKEISECTTDSKVLQLTAQDKDDPNTNAGKIQFKISENSQNSEIILRTFYISENILMLNIGSLKALQQNKISITVIAADGEGRSNETTIELDIKDCNDHKPFITLQSQNLKIRENEITKIFITRITVEDDDQGINSEFSCSLNDTTYISLDPHYQSGPEKSGQTKIFYLNSIPGTSFDREKTSRYSLEITCTDSGSPALSNSETIIIFIKDENDNPPRFENQMKIFSISEDATQGSDVGIVTAIDLDSSPFNIIHYSILGDEDSKQTFSINNQGLIQLSKKIDREVKDRYDFSVEAKDNGDKPLNDTCKIRVIVLDVNDNSPQINSEHHFKIVESWGQEHKHVQIGKLNATDMDSGINGTFRFKVKTSTVKSSQLQVNNDGKISIYGNIDREKSDKIEALIEVIDKGYPYHTTTTNIYIEVLDLNDNKPKFTFPGANNNNHINITYEMLGGANVGQAKATDPDQDYNGTVVFSLVSRDSAKDYFEVHEDGQIVLNKKWDEKVRYPDRLIIEARDKGIPPFKETSNLYIRYFKKRAIDVNNENGINSRHMDPKDLYSKNKNKGNGLSNAVILGFLVVLVLMILVVIGGVAIYIYCRGQGLPRIGENNKHLSTNRDSNNVIYQKGCAKNLSKAENQMNDTYNPVGIPTFQPNYTNLMLVKNNCFTPIDNSYQFTNSFLTDNYSAFQPKSNTPTPDKDNQEFSAFNPDESWKHSKHLTATLQLRKKNLSESSDNLYDSDHKYAFIHGQNISNFDMNHELNNITHFTTPSQTRRSDLIHSRSDTNQKVKVSLVNSSFV